MSIDLFSARYECFESTFKRKRFRIFWLTFRRYRAVFWTSSIGSGRTKPELSYFKYFRPIRKYNVLLSTNIIICTV